MQYRIVPAFVTALLLALPAAAQDIVAYRDRTAKPEKTATLTGEIRDETFLGVKIKPAVGAERLIPAGDVIDITYAMPGAVKIDYMSAISNDQKKSTTDVGRKAADDAEKLYAIVLSKLKDEKTLRIQRHLQFKMISLHAFLATGDKAKTADVVEQFEKFRKEHSNAWQAIPAARQEAQLLIEVENFDPAAKVYEDLLKNPDLAKDLKQDIEFATIDLLMKAKNFPVAATRIKDAIGRLPADDPQVERLKFYEIGCQAATADLKTVEPQLKAMIDKATDPGLKALGYNTLGDCFLAKGQKDEAKWAYLWVDAVYNQDRGELLKALDKLSLVFKELNDEDHSNKYKEKMARLK